MMRQRVFAALFLAFVVESAAAVNAAPTNATALDWSRPWVEPHDSRQAANDSDEYAWRLFVALNWPADMARRVADPKAALGAQRPVAWESWENASAVYREDGGDPGPWDTGRVSTVPDESRFETFSLKEIPIVRHIVGGKMVPLTDPAARARRLTEIRMNRAAFEYIRANELYNVDGQLRLISSGRVVGFPSAATEVKAKWRPIRDDERTRYHTVTVRLADGSERLYGLTALHIVSKALPQWFWATFEHVDNPTLPGNDGWQLPSSDRFACAGVSDNCNRAPRGIGLEGTVWQNYRLRGTLTRFVDDANRPLLLANSELEAGMQRTSSCMTCHARSSLALVGGAPVRLPVFEAAAGIERRGPVGLPSAAWFEDPSNHRKRLFEQLDFVWSLTKARPRKVPHET
jgi:hypothetical protein